MEFAHAMVFNDPAIDEITSGDLAGDYPALQYAPPQHDYWIDILARLGEAFRYSDLESELLEVDGVRVSVATPRMLYLMKKDTVRPQDRLDAETLRQTFAVEAMPPPPPRTPLDPRNLKIACDLSALAVGLRRRRFPPGLHKYRSVEEASRLRERWELKGE
jgi:hypothetical protein